VGNERGQGTIEYLAIVLVVAGVMAAAIGLLAFTGLGGKVFDAFHRALCVVTGGACDQAAKVTGPCVLASEQHTDGGHLSILMLRSGERDVVLRDRTRDVFGRRTVQGVGGLEEPQLAAAAGGKTLEHVAVGGKVARVGEESALAAIEDRAGQLEQVDGGRVADHDLAGPGAEDPLRQLVAHARRCVDPLLPAADEPRSPLGHERAQLVARGHRQAAERVSVEVDPLRVVDDEALAETGQPVSGVERLGVCAGQGSCSHRVTALHNGLPGWM